LYEPWHTFDLYFCFYWCLRRWRVSSSQFKELDSYLVLLM
jgi:hypothetical protein